MPEKIELTPEQIEQISGGTNRETAYLALALTSHGYGNFINLDFNSGYEVDYEGLKEFFAQKGWRFEPGYGDEKRNIFWGPDGMPYLNEHMIHVIEIGAI